jgi:hypothetical protein
MIILFARNKTGPHPAALSGIERRSAAQKLAVTEARIAGGEPGVMLLLLCAFG